MPKPRTDPEQQRLQLEAAEGHFEKTADHLIETEVRRLRKAFDWTNEGEAFAHLMAMHRFDLDEEDAALATRVGRAGHDKGIDGYYREGDGAGGTGTFFVVQAKYERKEYDDEVLFMDIRKAANFLNETQANSAKQALLEVLQEFRDARAKGEDIVFLLALNGGAGRVKEKLADFERGLPFPCQIEVMDVSEVQALVMASRVLPHRGPNVVLDSPAEPLELDLGRQLPRVAAFPARVNQLVDYVRKNRLGIFSVNVREYLTSRNPVNKVIAKSLKEKPEHFYYLNLGIDAVCDSYKIVQQSGLENPSGWTVSIKNFQIVNGCQTAKTAADADPAPSALVMVRIVQLQKQMKKEMVPEISIAKNRQSPIHGRDLLAWDKDQIRLKKEFEKMGVYFETRAKEWDEITKTKPQARNLYGQGVLDNEDAAKAYLAVYGQDPFRAKHRKKQFFQREGGVYDQIFKGVSAESLLVSSRIYELAASRSKAAGGVFRHLEDKGEEAQLTEPEKLDLMAANVVSNGDTYLAALMGYFLQRFYGRSLEHDEHLTSHILRHLSAHRTKGERRVLEPLYELSRETVVQAFFMTRGQHPSPELYSPHRFFSQEETYGQLQQQAHAKNLTALSKVLAPFEQGSN